MIPSRRSAMSNSQQTDLANFISVCIPARVEYLHLIRYVVHHGAKEFGFTGEEAAKIEMAADEACTNIILHGYLSGSGADTQPVYVNLLFEADRMIIQIVDRAESFSPLEHGKVSIEDHIREGRRRGLGIYIMKSFMDEINHDYDRESGNKLELVKFLPSRGEAHQGAEAQC